jgi:hypothetical protein
MTGKDTSLIAREGELSSLGELAAPPYAKTGRCCWAIRALR